MSRALLAAGCALVVAPGLATARAAPARRDAPAAVLLGPLRGAPTVDVDLVLRPRDPPALARFATAVSTPGSPSFGHYLGKGRFARAFGPTGAAIARVASWLRRRGIVSWSMSANHLTVRLASPASALERAFATRLDRYRIAGGRVALVATPAPRVPAALAGVVLGVVGLDGLVAPAHLDVGATTATVPGGREPRSTAPGPQACSLAAASAAVQHAYTASQLARAYGFTPLYARDDEGQGVTIALFEQETDRPSDVAAYQRCYGTHARVRYVRVDGGAPTEATDGEAAMDIEVALGMAPKASLEVYRAPATTAGTLDEYTAIVDQDHAAVVSTSWGVCEARTGATLIEAESSVFEQAAAQGQTVVAAAGDDGSEGCQSPALGVLDPASQPFVTSVGGTTLVSVAHGPAERAWNDSALRTGAGGGGISAWHPMPGYQARAAARLHVVSRLSSGVPCRARARQRCRELPDVAADADRSTGYVIFQDGGWASNAGTSAAAPLWAALVALADASPSCRGRVVGFANPALYAAAARSYTADFHDVTAGNNDYTPDGNTSGLYPAGPGYDMATGLGSPDASRLVATLCALHASPVRTTTRLIVSAPMVTVGHEGSLSFTATVTGRRGDGRPLGTVQILSGSTVLCSGPARAATSAASRATCSPGSSALRPGRHVLQARYVPARTSSSDPTFAYGASRSEPRTLTVEPAT